MKTSAALMIALLAWGCSGGSGSDQGGGGTGASGGNGSAGSANTGSGGTGSSNAGRGSTGSGTGQGGAAGTGTPPVAGNGSPDPVDSGTELPDAGPSAPQLPEPSFERCAIPAEDSTSEVQGAWAGSVRLEQNLLGVMKETDVLVEVFLDSRSAPRRHLAAIAYLGDGWTVTLTDPNATSLAAFVGEGGNGMLWGYNAFEADGGANALSLADSCIEATDSSFAWRYAITYHVADVVDRELYGYADPSAPLVTLAAQELYAVIDDTLYLRASSEGTTEAGEPVAFRMTGALKRITR